MTGISGSPRGQFDPGSPFLIALARANPHLFWTAARDGQTEFFNQPWTDYTGMSFEESVGEGWQAAIHPDDLPGWLAWWGGAMPDGRSDEIEIRLRAADGNYGWFLGRMAPVQGEDGTVERWIVSFTDIDEIKRGQEASARLAAIVESSQDAIISMSLYGVIDSWNAAAERLYGYAADEIIGRPIDVLIPPDRQYEEVKLLERLRLGERIEHFESVRVARNGRLIDVSLTISPVRDRSGRVTGASKTAGDITERKRSEEELRAAKDAAEEANRAKDQFLAMLSHELRTPLTPILATVSYLERLPELNAELREEIVSIRRQVEVESRLIDDLLDVTRITRGKVNLRLETCNVHTSLRSALEVCQDAIEGKRLDVSLALNAREHLVQGDPARLQQIFWNLIQNAVKFTPEGGSIRLRSSNPGPRRITVDVVDTGVGIPPDALPRIFKAFEQGDRADARRQGGLGLGLTITRSLVELHGGVITARSAGPNQGSVFTVEFDTFVAVEAVRPPDPPLVEAQVNGLKILLVEDNPDTLRAISRLLCLSGFLVETATTVASAIKATALQRFDLVVSDIGLPDGTGLEFMRHVRKRYGLRGIAFSGYGTDEDVRASMEAGFEHHLTKPIKIDQLVGLIRRVAS